MTLNNVINETEEDSGLKTDPDLKNKGTFSDSNGSGDLSDSVSADAKTVFSNQNSSKRTLFSEYEAIDIVIKIINLLSLLHELNIVHTNLNPSSIFMKGGNTSSIHFLDLYHCSWKPKEILPHLKLGAEFEDNFSLYDIRTRNFNYVSPEQHAIAFEIA